MTSPTTANEAACVFIYSPLRKQVLLVTRKDKSGVALPGGKVDEGETPREAAIRESFEETGLRLVLQTDPAFTEMVFLEGHEFLTSCWYLEYDGPTPGGLEPGVTPFWGSISELVTNSPFRAWNSRLLGVLSKRTPHIPSLSSLTKIPSSS